MWQDLRYAARVLLKSPSFAAVAILSLATGIGVNSAMFSIVHAVLLAPLPYRAAGQLVVVREHAPGDPGQLDKVSPANFLDWQLRATSIEGMAAFIDNYTTAYNLTGRGDATRVSAISTTGGFFALLGVQPVLGGELRAGETRADRTVLLSHDFWMRHFAGDPSVVGTRVSLSDTAYTVLGVLPADFWFRRHADVWPQFNAAPGGAMTRDRSTRWWTAVGRLREGVTQDAAQRELDAIAAQLASAHPAANAGRGVRVLPLRSDMAGGAVVPLRVLFAAVCLVLLVACANVAGLLLARLAAREREVGVRVALGATRARLARQMLAESLVLAAPAAFAGLLLAHWVVDALVAIAPSDLPRIADAGLDWRVVLFTTAAALGCALAFGSAPIWQVSRADGSSALRAGRTVVPASARLRRVLIVGQLAVALVLLTGGGLLVRSYAGLARVHPGFDARDVVTLNVALHARRYFDDWNAVVGFYREALAQLGAVPGVTSVGATSLVPFGEGSFADRVAAGRTPSDELKAEYRFVSPDYFKTLRMTLVAGRDITAGDNASGIRVAVLGSSTAKRMFGDADPVGQEILLRGKTRRTVVGVVADTHLSSLGAAPPLQVYMPFEQASDVYWTGLTFVMRTASDADAVASAAQHRIRAIDPSIPAFNMSTVDQLVARALSPTRMYASVLTAFAAVAAALACIGVYGLIAYVVAHRTREMGIRLALGATPRDMSTLILREGMVLAGAGALLGALGAFAAARVLQSLLFDVKPHDPITFLLGVFVLGAAAALSSWIPARRARRIDPVTALRAE